jgi:hypothetical protein
MRAPIVFAHVLAGLVSAPVLVGLRGVASGEALQQELDALRPNGVKSQGTAVRDSLERQARDALAAISWAHTVGDADRMRTPVRRELDRSPCTSRLS